MFEPIIAEEQIIKPKPPRDQLALRQSYIKGHINAIRTHVLKAKGTLKITELPVGMYQKIGNAEALLAKQLTKVERDAHDMFEVVKKAIK